MGKWRVVGKIYGMKYSWKGHKDRNRQEQKKKKEWANLAGLCQKRKRQHPNHMMVSLRGPVYRIYHQWYDDEDDKMNIVQGLQGKVGEGGHSTSGVVVPYTEPTWSDQTARCDRGSCSTALCWWSLLLPQPLRFPSAAAVGPSLQVLKMCVSESVLSLSFSVGVLLDCVSKVYSLSSICTCVCLCVYTFIQIMMISHGKRTISLPKIFSRCDLYVCLSTEGVWVCVCVCVCIPLCFQQSCL